MTRRLKASHFALACAVLGASSLSSVETWAGTEANADFRFGDRPLNAQDDADQPRGEVRGTLTFNDRPWREGIVTFRAPGRKESFSATADAYGSFTRSGVPPGDYEADVRDKRLPFVWTRRILLTPGDNTIDLGFLGDVAAVRVVPDTIAAQLVLSGDGFTLRVRVTRGSWAQPLELPLPPGAYTFSADADGSLSSGTETVVLGRTGNTHPVDMFLRKTEGIAFVLAVDDAPIPDAFVASLGRVGRRLQLGVFSLAGFPRDSPVIISARGHVPTCRTVYGGDIRVVLTKGTPVEVQTRVPIPDFRHGTVEGLSGSECPVPVSAFEFRILTSAVVGETRFRIASFPENSVATWRRSGTSPVVLSSAKNSRGELR